MQKLSKPERDCNYCINVATNFVALKNHLIKQHDVYNMRGEVEISQTESGTRCNKCYNLSRPSDDAWPRCSHCGKNPRRKNKEITRRFH